MPKDIPESPQLLGEISQAPSAFEQFLDRHTKGLVVVAIAAALAGCGWVIYRGLERSHERDAGTALVKAEDITALQTVVKDYPKTEAAGSAAVLLADKQWADGQQDAAIKTLQDFIQAKADHPARAAAQASLGAKFALQGKNAEAEAAFQAVIGNPSAKYLAPYALTQLGDLAKLAGDADKAKGYYEKAKNDYPGNNFGTVASQHLLELKAKAPVEIEAPAPPPGAPGDVAPADLLNPGAPTAPFGFDGGAPVGGLPPIAPPAPPAPAAPDAPAVPEK